jgi:hypothetical protein
MLSCEKEAVKETAALIGLIHVAQYPVHSLESEPDAEGSGASSLEGFALWIWIVRVGGALF